MQPYLNQLGFNLVGYGCTTCIGNSGPLDPTIEQVVNDHDLIAASVLSGNRNFEARVHQSIKANFLMSPPLVVAFALAGRVDIDLSTRAARHRASDGEDVYLRDIWPSMRRDQRADARGVRSRNLSHGSTATSRSRIRCGTRFRPRTGNVYEWDAGIDLHSASRLTSKTSATHVGELCRRSWRAAAGDLRRFGDHGSHQSGRRDQSQLRRPGCICRRKASTIEDFNSYGARRGNHEVMVRGTFANVRIKNLMVPGVEGGVTIHQPTASA